MLLNCGVGEFLRVPWTARRSNQSIQKEISPGIRDWGWEEKGTTEDEMAGWHQQLNGHAAAAAAKSQVWVNSGSW